MREGGASPVANRVRALARQGRQARESARTRVAGGIAEQFLDPQQLVVLRYPLTACGRAGLDLPAVGRDVQVGDRGVIGLAGAVADYTAEPGAVREAHRVQCLG